MVTNSILDPEYHDRLIADIENIAAHANIPPHLIHQSSEPYLTKAEGDWLRDVHNHHIDNKFGMVIVGNVSVSIQIKFMAMGAFCVRNYIDGVVLTLADLLKPQGHNPTVLLVPNFYTSSEGKPLSSWQIQELQSVLTKRIVESKQTILYVSDMAMMKQHYGEAVHNLLVNNYNAYKE